MSLLGDKGRIVQTCPRNIQRHKKRLAGWHPERQHEPGVQVQSVQGQSDWLDVVCGYKHAIGHIFHGPGAWCPRTWWTSSQTLLQVTGEGSTHGSLLPYEIQTRHLSEEVELQAAIKVIWHTKIIHFSIEFWLLLFLDTGCNVLEATPTPERHCPESQWPVVQNTCQHIMVPHGRLGWLCSMPRCLCRHLTKRHCDKHWGTVLFCDIRVICCFLPLKAKAECYAWSTQDACAEHDGCAADLLRVAHLCVHTGSIVALYLSTWTLPLIMVSNEVVLIFLYPGSERAEGVQRNTALHLKTFPCLWLVCRYRHWKCSETLVWYWCDSHHVQLQQCVTKRMSHTFHTGNVAALTC